MKKVDLILVIIVCISIGAIVAWQYAKKSTEQEAEVFPVSEVQEAPSSEEIELKRTEKYGIFGDDEFDTVALGYLETKEVDGFENDKQTNAYFVITDFSDEGFRESIKAGIERGNNVNFREGPLYKFNLGCFGDGAIVGIEYNKDEPYINDETQEALIGSSAEKPVSVILSFGKHLGMGCTCCNLAHKVRIAE